MLRRYTRINENQYQTFYELVMWEIETNSLVIMFKKNYSFVIEMKLLDTGERSAFDYKISTGVPEPIYSKEPVL